MHADRGAVTEIRRPVQESRPERRNRTRGPFEMGFMITVGVLTAMTLWTVFWACIVLIILKATGVLNVEL